MLGVDNQESEIFVSGEKSTVEIGLKGNETVAEATVGILIRDKFGQDIFGTNTHHQKIPIGIDCGKKCIVKYNINELNIGPGKYTLTVAAHKGDSHIDECYQWVDVVRSFEVIGPKDFAFIGISKLKPSITVALK